MLVYFGLLVSVWFMSNPCCIRWIPCFLCSYISPLFHCTGNVCGWVPICCLRSAAKVSACDAQTGGVRVGSCRWWKHFCGCVRKIFWRAIYCAKTSPNPSYQSSSLSNRGLGRQATQIMLEYDLAAMIAIWPLTQPRNFERGSSIFVMSLSFFSLSQWDRSLYIGS